MSLFQKKPKVEVTDLNKRFDLISRVGQGSMSKVWRADDAINNRFVAVKLLDKEKTNRYEARFKGLSKPGEGDIALSLHHPNIVQTFEIGHTAEDETFLVMEYVDGCGLGLLVDLQSDRMVRYRTRFMIQIGEALKHFHENHWIHRDICPRNIMVTEDNNIKLIDFGLTVPDTPDFRKPGNRTGTANYMAPELIKRQPTDQRIDVFSYAVTCFEMYTKRHPWDAAMTIDAVLQHINKPPIQITELVPRIDPQIAETIMKGLEANPGERWQTIAEMVREFREAEVRLVKKTRELLTRRKKAKGAKEAPQGAAKQSPKQTAAKKLSAEDAAAEVLSLSDPDADERPESTEEELLAPLVSGAAPAEDSEVDKPLASQTKDVAGSGEGGPTHTDGPDEDDEDEVLSLD